jgi:hypothetical protein
MGGKYTYHLSSCIILMTFRFWNFDNNLDVVLQRHSQVYANRWASVPLSSLRFRFHNYYTIYACKCTVIYYNIQIIVEQWKLLFSICTNWSKYFVWNKCVSSSENDQTHLILYQTYKAGFCLKNTRYMSLCNVDNK